ncbi:hypothetical protein M1O55_03630, partial [Dehalococcoidia bacterium]|nr:hypothetical protein [Dehalococcoidia bacterium]
AVQGLVGDVHIAIIANGAGHGPHDVSVSGPSPAELTEELTGNRADGDSFEGQATVGVESPT